MKTVIKIGTSTIAHRGGRLNIRRTQNLCEIISDIKNAGHEIIIVTSGAIGMGVGKLGLPGRPDDIAGKQAAAAVGQCELMYTYDKYFSEYRHTVGQILLTKSDFEDEETKRICVRHFDRDGDGEKRPTPTERHFPMTTTSSE